MNNVFYVIIHEGNHGHHEYQRGKLLIAKNKLMMIFTSKHMNKKHRLRAVG